MTSLSKFLLRRSDDDIKLIVGVAAIAIVGGMWTASAFMQASLHNQPSIGAPLYGHSLQAFLDTLDTKPDGKVDSLRLNKAADRFMADVVQASLKAARLEDGAVHLADDKEQAAYHLDPRRYDPVSELEYTIRTSGKFRIGVRRYGPQAAEKLASLKETVAHFEKMTSAIKRDDVEVAKSELQTIQHALEAYLAKYHAKEEDMDRSSTDLRFLGRKLDALNDSLSSVPKAHVSAPKVG
ncbi:hypothetical protein OIU34_23215 [Pararhizobium sp. BT-229]|uniref:hypothetical protein n=1 Tax=Pararhizobium sp. BT-229 TaxID=2986923 RepID=UPI0021F7B94B|nr:hypothetical protein [Pararhizobium sp. BT-229]MCV9964806.1 hypothetical protein [Pararhizobium sp. BT-229]